MKVFRFTIKNGVIFLVKLQGSEDLIMSRYEYKSGRTVLAERHMGVWASQRIGEDTLSVFPRTHFQSAIFSGEFSHPESGEGVTLTDDMKECLFSDDLTKYF